MVDDPTRKRGDSGDDRPLAERSRLSGRLSRRDVLRRGLALGLSAPLIGTLLAACGGDDDDDDGGGGGTTATATTPSGGAASPTASGGGATAPAATATTGGGGGASGGTLVIGRDISDLVSWDVGWLYEISTGPVNVAVYPPMVLQDPADINRYLPVLCEEVPSVENGGISEDGLTWTFKLRKGVKFHTGGEMKAQDYVFCMNRIAYLKGNPSFLADPFTEKDADGNPTKVNATAVDDYTLEITLNEPNMAFMAYMAGQVGQVYDSAFAKTQGATDQPDAAEKDTAKAWFDSNSAGPGPYKITAWTKETEVILERFEDFQPLGEMYPEAAAFEKIVFKHIPGSGQQLQQLQGGETQVAMELDADAIGTIEGSSDFSVSKGQSLNLVYLGLMTQEDPGKELADVRVRQAIAYGLDYSGYTEGLLGGAAVRPASPVPLGFLGTDLVQDKAYQEDLDKAKALLAEAGAEGAELTLAFGAGAAYNGVANETTAAKVQADLERIGLKIKQNPMDPGQRLQDFRDAKLQFTFSEWGPDFLDVHSYAFPFGGVEGEAPAKRVKYVSEESTQLLADAIKEADATKRAELYAQVMENLIEDVPFVPLWQTVFQYGVGSAATNVVVHPGWLMMTHWIKPA